MSEDESRPESAPAEGEETKSVNVPFTPEKHEEMRRKKDWHDLSWRQVIERGIDDLPEPPQEISEE